MIKYVRRSFVTLVELLIVMSIVALVGSFVAIGISRALVDQRFKSELSLVIDQMNLAQDLMLILGTDVHVKFKSDQGGNSIEFWIEIERELPKSIKKEFIEKKYPLKTIKGVFFKDKLDDAYLKGSIDIRFLSNGMVMSQGVVRLATSDKEPPPDNVLQAYIVLAGYPRPIVSVDNKIASDELVKKFDDTSFNEPFTKETLSKLPEKKKEEDTSSKTKLDDKGNSKSKKSLLEDK